MCENTAPRRLAPAISTQVEETRNWAGYIVNPARVLVLTGNKLISGGDAIR